MGDKKMKMSPVVHFEMPAQDRKRMANFYTRVFGWQAQQLGPEMGNYVIVTTTELGEYRFPKEPGRINGAFSPRRRITNTLRWSSRLTTSRRR